MNNNISVVADNKTAHTHVECASQRAENLAILGAQNVLELCVGPSLKDLEKAYQSFQIQVTGNDIDPRWQEYYPEGKWLMGDALSFDIDILNQFDAIVFAPPLSKGCTGKRCDSLSVMEVQPGYLNFINKVKDYQSIKVMVLPGRSLATRYDRKQFHQLMSNLKNVEVVPLMVGKRKIVKYYDLYWQS